MTISENIKELKQLLKSFENGKSLELYCKEKHLSYKLISKYIKIDFEDFYLLSVYHILGLRIPGNIPASLLCLAIKDLIQIEKYFENQFSKNERLF